MPLEPWQWALAFLCATMNGVAKTGVPGLGILVVPLMLFVIVDPRISPGVVLPLLCLADLFAVLYYRRHAQWDRVIKLVPWVALGLGCGVAGLWAVDHFGIGDDVLNKVIGVIVLVMIIMQILRQRSGDAASDASRVASPLNLENAVENHFTAKPPRAQRTYSKDKNHSFGEAEDPTNVNSKPWISWRLCDLAVEVCIPIAFFRLKAAAFGITTGFATYIANAAGPVMNLYLLSMALPKSEFMGTGAWFFFVINLVKVPQFVLQGRITAETLWLDLCLAPAVIAGALLGRWLFSRIPQLMFERIIIVLVLLATVTLFLPHR